MTLLTVDAWACVLPEIEVQHRSWIEDGGPKAFLHGAADTLPGPLFSLNPVCSRKEALPEARREADIQHGEVHVPATRQC